MTNELLERSLRGFCVGHKHGVISNFYGRYESVYCGLLSCSAVFYPEVGSSRFLRNVGNHVLDYTVS
jgi:hypothetical protein